MLSVTRTSATLAAVLIGGSILAASPAAAAQPPRISASCETLSVELQDYPSSETAPTPNTVTVSVDGDVVANEAFGSSYTAALPVGDATVAHDWSVTISALGASFNPTFTGTSTPCEPEPQWNATAAAAVSLASCASGAQVVLGDISNAAWGPVESDGVSYSVTAVADPGHLFDDGLPERVFSGPLAAALPASSPDCAPAPEVLSTTVNGTTAATPQVESAAVLAHNGTDSVPALLAAFALLGSGIVLMRRRAARSAG